MATDFREAETLAPAPDSDLPPSDTVVDLDMISVGLDTTIQTDITPGIPVGFPLPTRVIVREIEIAENAMGPLVYRRPDRATVVQDDSDIRDIIKDIRDDDYDYQEDVPTFFKPLDLNLSAPTCFIIRLTGGLNWRFSHKTKGATLGPTADPTNYCNLMHVYDDNVGQPGPHPHGKYCRMIYFYAKPPAGTPTPRFKHAFNLNIEFVYPDGIDDDRINTIPIVIDPDVRHPGGSGA